MAQPKQDPRPGRVQRRRCGLAWLLVLVLWGGRWIWPLLWLPGWVVVLVGAWAVLELVAVLLAPRRWR